MFSWWSCETFTERVSKALDGKLPWYEKPSYYFRLLMCSTSRRFRRQLYKMEDVASKYGCCCAGADESLDDEVDDPSVSLDRDASERLRAALQQALVSGDGDVPKNSS